MCVIGTITVGYGIYKGVKMAHDYWFGWSIVSEAEVIVPARTIRMGKASEPKDIKAYVKQQLEKAGIGNEWELVNKIIECESKWGQWHYNVNSNDTTDMGLWQINSIHKGKADVECRFDIECSTKWAIEKRLHDGNWSAWVCNGIVNKN